jgi:mono/diheme cytochrome c family protein
MWKKATLICAFVCLAVVSKAQDNKKTDQENGPAKFKIPPEDASRKNPVASNPSSIAEGKRFYGFDCAACHGNEGDGKGDLVESMKLKLRDWRDPAALKDFTDGEIFYIVNKGTGQMSGEGGRVKPEQIWQMVNYIRSLAKNESPSKTTDEKPNG